MRLPPFVLLALVALPTALLAGCTGGDDEAPLVSCDGDLHAVRLYLGPDHSLQPTVPEGGRTPGNAFSSAFLTNSLDEWLSGSIVDPLHLEGNVTLVLFVESTGTPAPIPQGDPGNGYQLFNQFGSDRTLQPGYATENAAIVQSPGTQTRYRETLVLPPGGFELEAGDRVRLLITSLAVDSPSGSGQDILYGNPTASYLQFDAACTDAKTWGLLDDRRFDVELAGNQGLFSGALSRPELAQLNAATFPLTLHPEAQRLTIDLAQTSDPVPLKDDIDLEIVDAGGNVLYGIGSPYSDEHGVLWEGNLEWLRAHNATGVRVNSYSGLAYAGALAITQERAL